MSIDSPSEPSETEDTDRSCLAGERQQHLRRLNLNLLYPLDAILHASTLTKAGYRVSLSQSAMSHALKRLRKHFGDDLVVWSGRSLILTGVGEAIRCDVRRLLREADELFGSSRTFDSRTSDRHIVVAASKSLEQLVLAPLLARLALEAPRMKFSVLQVDPSRGSRSSEAPADIFVAPGVDADDPSEATVLFEDSIACMLRRGHPSLSRGSVLTAEAYMTARHLIVAEESHYSDLADQSGQWILSQRDIAVTTTSQADAPWYLANANLIVTGSSWLFQSIASTRPLVVTSPPFSSARVPILARLAPNRRGDPAVLWLLAEIESATSALRP